MYLYIFYICIELWQQVGLVIHSWGLFGRAWSGPHSVADFFGKEVRDCSKLSTLLVMELKKNGPRRRQTGGLAGH